MGSGLIVNPLAPLVSRGIPGSFQGGEYIDVDYTQPFDITLAVNQLATGLQVGLPNDTDFILRAIHYTQPNPAALAPFNWRVGDAQGYYLSNTLIFSGNLSVNPAQPTPVMPELIFPRGGVLIVDLQNTSAFVTNQIQLAFRGVKRYRMAG